MLLASFDIGKINFSFIIESIDIITPLNMPKKRYIDNGTCTLEFHDTLKKVYKQGKIILYKKYNLLEQNSDLICGLYDVLDKYIKYWDGCSYFVIEKQIKKNPTAVRIQHMLVGYFKYRYGSFKEVIEFPAYHKGNILGAEKVKGSRKRKGLKPWAIREMKVILECKKQEDILKYIMSNKKRDDYADAICQLQAFKILHLI